MKDTQVEKIVGLPEEIFRGFPKIEEYSYDVTIAGQLNYTCWRYRKFLKEKIIGSYFDTTFIINNIKYTSDEASEIKDTIFYNKIIHGDSILSSEHWHYYREDSPYSERYSFVPVKSKFLIINQYDHIAICSKCVLFDPSSNRVVDVGFYPILVHTKTKIFNKKLVE
jgi:hypothetical protein